MISTPRSWWAVREPLVTSTEIGYCPASIAAGGLAVTVTGVVAPAFTSAFAAWLSELTWVVIVQPSGPVATPVNVRSSEVSLCRVRLNVNVVVDGPLSDGKSVVRLTCAGRVRASPGCRAAACRSRPGPGVDLDPLGRAGRGGRHGHVEADGGRGRAVGLDAVDDEPAAEQRGRPVRGYALEREVDPGRRVGLDRDVEADLRPRERRRRPDTGSTGSRCRPRPRSARSRAPGMRSGRGRPCDVRRVPCWVVPPPRMMSAAVARNLRLAACRFNQAMVKTRKSSPWRPIRRLTEGLARRMVDGFPIPREDRGRAPTKRSLPANRRIDHQTRSPPDMAVERTHRSRSRWPIPPFPARQKRVLAPCCPVPPPRPLPGDPRRCAACAAAAPRRAPRPARRTAAPTAAPASSTSIRRRGRPPAPSVGTSAASTDHPTRPSSTGGSSFACDRATQAGTPSGYGCRVQPDAD